MGAGKGLSIVSGILSLVAVYLLVWFTGTSGPAYGLNAAMAIMSYFGDAATIAGNLSVQVYIVYIIGVLIILTLLAPILQLIGAKSKASAIIGALFPLLIGLIIILNQFGLLASLPVDLYMYVDTIFSGNFEIMAGTLPFLYELPIPSAPFSLGTIFLALGGLLGLISGFMSRDDY